MRNATILVVNLKGVATETIKNIVLAGIGKLVLVDDQDVSEEDLGAGFFLTDGDVGKKVEFSQKTRMRLLTALVTQRVDAAKSRIESLNPLVAVETLSSMSVLDDEHLEKTLHAVDMVCITDADRETMVSESLRH
jgi:ubiquitin-like 1-activating enzyme E1 A